MLPQNHHFFCINERTTEYEPLNTLKTFVTTFIRSIITHPPSAKTNITAKTGKGLPCTTASDTTADTSGR